MTIRFRLLLLAVGLALFAPCSDAQGPASVAITQPSQAPARRAVELSGSFLARRYARLSPRLPGLVADAPRDTGDRVVTGEVVMRLDPRLAELAVAQAEAQRDAARTDLAEAIRLAEEARRLAADRFVPETEIAAREAAVAGARAALAVGEAALATARERLARHTVPAPFDGVVAARLVEVGEWVETGTAVVELVATDALWLDVRAPQQLWGQLDREVRASAWIDALDRRVEARVHARVPVNDPAARTFLVRLVLTGPPALIVPGMSATVRFEWVEDRHVLAVPRDAIIRFPDGTTTVWVVTAGPSGPTAHQREVTVEAYEGDRAELSEGLAADARVVIRGNEVLTEGQPVHVVEASQ